MSPHEDKSGGAYEPLPDVEQGDAAEPGVAAPHARRPLSLLPLIALIFFEVSGGPFGTEVGDARGHARVIRLHESLDRPHGRAPRRSGAHVRRPHV
jgi:hypothetical protein